MRVLAPVSKLLTLLTVATSLPMGFVAPAAAQTGVSDDRVSLPDGPGSLEGIGENAAVDPNSGLMNLPYPFRLPQGYAGMTPNITLTYSSGRGSGAAGMGWDLNLQSIERLTKRGLPRYLPEDEFAGPSGELVLVDDTDPTAMVYRARFEGAFVRYTWFDAEGTGEGGYWMAEMPDGRIGYFGADRDGTLVSAAREEGADGTFRYHLVETWDRYDHVIRTTFQKYGNVARPLQTGWAWVNGVATHEVTYFWEDRPDPVSDAKSGVELLDTQRLDSLTVRSRGANLRRYQLTYEDPAESGGFSRLVLIESFGTDGSEYGIEHTFSYTKGLGTVCEPGDCVQPQLRSMGTLSATLTGGKATLIDINGDALPDVVDTGQLSGAHRLFVNTMSETGAQTFAPPVDSTIGTQGAFDLSTAAVQVLDINGDGFADMLNALTGTALINLGGGDWEPTLSELWANGQGILPDLTTQLATTRFMDYDGDKRIDLVTSNGDGAGNETLVYRSLGEAGFEVDDTVTPIGATFAGGVIELNDMNGDGLLDPVQVQQAVVRYKLNLGYGRWSDDWLEVGGFDFSAQEQQDVELEDLNGDGLADLVLVAGNVVTYWLNRNGAIFDGPYTLTDADVQDLTAGLGIPTKTSDVVLLHADMNGNGSVDLVWFEPSGQVTFLEMFPVRPNLMLEASNSMGRTTSVEYGSSVEQQAADGGVGAWAYPLPHPMTVVTRISESEAVAQLPKVQEYSYHDGYYDGVEKDFRGYERVETTRPGDAWQDEGGSRQVWNVGVSDTYANGLLVSQEEWTADGVVWTESHEYADCAVAHVPPPGSPELLFDVRWVCETAVNTVHREGLTDPSEWVTVREEMTYDGYGNVTWEAKLGVVDGCKPCAATSDGYDGTPCGAQCLGDELYATTEFAVPADNEDRWLLRFPVRERQYGIATPQGEPATEVYTERTIHYDGPEYQGLSFGLVTHGSPSRTLERVDASGAVDAIQRNRYDAHGNVVEQIAPDGDPNVDADRRRLWTFDAAGLRIEEAAILVGGSAATNGPYALVREYEWHPVYDQIAAATTWRVVQNGVDITPRVEQRYAYDTFGMITALFRPEDPDDAPSEVYTYDYGSPYTAITRQSRTTVGGPLDLATVTCLDGFGRTYQERKKVGEGDWVVTSHNLFGAQGATRIAYGPWESPSGACTATPDGSATETVNEYDGLGRLERTVMTPGASDSAPREVRSIYRPLEVWRYDEIDNDPEHPQAGTPAIQRVNGLDWRIATDTMVDSAGGLSARTIRYDTLGHIRGIVDPSGLAREQVTDFRGRVVSVDHPDSGLTLYTYDANSKVTRMEDAEGRVVRTTYDAVERPVAYWEEDNEAATRVEFGYDVPASDCDAETECSYTAGYRSWTTYPLGGGAVGTDIHGYSPRGLGTFVRRTLDGRAFELRTDYDHAGRSVQDTFPTGLTLTRELDGVGRVVAIPGYLDAVAYDKAGNLSEIHAANGAMTTLAYDDRDFVSSITTSTPSAAKLLDYAYTRNALGLITEVADGADDAGGPNQSAAYTYDPLYRVTQFSLSPGTAFAESIAVTFDAADRILSKTSTLGPDSPAHVGSYSYGENGAGPRAVTTAGDVDYAYDPAGRMVQKGGTTLSWDYTGRLLGTSGPNGTATYAYADSRTRVMKTEGGVRTFYIGDDFEVRAGQAIAWVTLSGEHMVRIADPSYAATVFDDLAPATGDDFALAAQPDGVITAADAWLAHAVTTNLVGFGDGTTITTSVDELLEATLTRMLSGDEPGLEFLHHDHAGNAVAVTDINGEVVSRHAYYPYGGSRWSSSGGFEIAEPEYGFSGKERDASGLVYFGGRYLDAHSGRWTQPDPRFWVFAGDAPDGQLQATATYGYNAGDPINRRDLDGEFAILAGLVTFSAGGAIIGGVSGLVSGTLIAAMKSAVIPDRKFMSKTTLGEVAMRAGGNALAGAMTGGTSAIGDIISVALVGATALFLGTIGSSMDAKTKEKWIDTADWVGYCVSSGMAAAVAFAGKAVIAGVRTLGSFAWSVLNSYVTAKTGYSVIGGSMVLASRGAKKLGNLVKKGVKKIATGIKERRAQRAAASAAQSGGHSGARPQWRGNVQLRKKQLPRRLRHLHKARAGAATR